VDDAINAGSAVRGTLADEISPYGCDPNDVGSSVACIIALVSPCGTHPTRLTDVDGGILDMTLIVIAH
jgi:hypothetical protein